MDFYPLFVFEVDKLSSPIWSIDDVTDLVKRLRQEENESANLPPDPRFIRLGQLLARKLPDEEGDFWLCRPEDDLPDRRKIWQPELRGTDRMERLLKVLLPLARGLHLGVFDAMFGFYIPPEIQKMPLPKGKEALQYRAEFDQDFLRSIEERQAGGSGKTGQLTKDSLNEYVAKILTPILDKHGFVRHPQCFRCFRRKIDGGFQEIEASSMSYSYVMPLVCHVSFEQHSERIAAIRTQWNDFGDGLPEPKYIDTLSMIFSLSLDNFRNMDMPGWKNIDGWATELALSKEEADWIIDDTLRMGLSFLNRFRVFTVDDADRFFHEHSEFSDKLMNATGRSLADFVLTTIYARLAGKRDFEAVVRHFEQTIETDDGRKKFSQVVDVCRNHLQPVNGSEPA